MECTFKVIPDIKIDAHNDAIASVTFSDAAGFPPELVKVAERIASGSTTEVVYLSFDTPITTMLDEEISNRLCDGTVDAPVFSSEDEAYFEAIKDNLLALVQRINAFKYEK